MQSPVMSPVLLLLLLLVPAVPASLVTDAPFIPSKTPDDVPEKKCYVSGKGSEFCSALSDVNGPVQNKGSAGQVGMLELVDAWREVKHPENQTEDWRTGSEEEINRVLLERRLYTDCTFVVGPDNNTQEFQAHQLLLARASPVFEALFPAKGRKIRIDDITPENFKTILEFVYTGDVCLTIYDSTCELLGVATRLQLPKLVETVRSYLWTSMTPKNVWQAYQCGLKRNDEQLIETALQMIERHTEQALQDPQFLEISRDSLISILSRDYLSISESKLFEASLRCATANVMRMNQSPNPESLRAALGPALGYIRFLTFTSSEFANIQFTSKILTYTEGLAILFNINSPGVMPLPEGISSNNNTRSKNINNAFFDVLEKPDFTCKGKSINLATEYNIYEFVSTTLIPSNSDNGKVDIESVKIPIRFKRDDNSTCSKEYEDLTVYVIKNGYEIIGSKRYQGWNIICGKNKKEEDLMTIYFSDTVNFEQSYSGYKIKVVFNQPGRYPFSVGTGNFNRESDYRYGKWQSKYTFGRNKFIHSFKN